MFHFKFISLPLLVILFLAFFLRIINIQSNPPALYGDELTMLLDVNSILHTGFDQTGKFLPLNFTMGGGRPVGYGYFSIPFVAIFGQSILGVRILSVLSGVGVVLLIYFIGKLIFSKKVGIVAAFLMAISPWDLTLSRGGFETHFALFLALGMILTFLLSEKRPWLLILSALFFGFSINTYSTFKLSLPLFSLIFLRYSYVKININFFKKNPSLIIAGLIVMVFISVLIIQSVFNKSESRFLDQNIFLNKDMQRTIDKKIADQRGVGNEEDILGKVFINKYWEYGALFAKNYLNTFSPEYLFLSGDKNPRHNMTSSGVVYLVEIITILFGLIFLIKKESYSKIIILISWLVISPIPAALLSDPHSLRSSFMLPCLILLSSVGALYIWNLQSRFYKVLKIIVVIGIFIQFVLIMQNLYFVYPNKSSRFWGYPAKMASELAISYKDKFDFIFIADRIDSVEFAYPVYADISPQKIMDENKSQTKIGEYYFRKYENVYIGPIPDSAAERFLDNFKEAKILYIGPSEDEKLLREFRVIKGEDGVKALLVKSIRNNL
jgi:4-amino-4-deoxy-L-arabinose transferase-like glycosyltransferase